MDSLTGLKSQRQFALLELAENKKSSFLTKKIVSGYWQIRLHLSEGYRYIMPQKRSLLQQIGEKFISMC